MAEQYKSAEDVIAKGMGNKWIKIESQFQREVIVDSIAGCNLARSPKPALRHYEREGYLVICDGPGSDADTHPNDIK